MEHLETFFRIGNALFPFRDFLYLLQLEDYRTMRFVKLFPRFFFRRNIEVRDSLVFTIRIRIIYVFAVMTLLSKWISIYWMWGVSPVSFAYILLTIIAIPFYVLFAHLITLPILSAAHSYVQKKAKEKIAQMPQLRVIMIVGSFGKTTARAYIHEMLKLSYRVETLPGNINTETGVAQWISTSLKPGTEILIIEADAYARGDISRMCEIVRPSISVITALGDQHLDRLGSRENLIEATQEVFADATPDAYCIARKNVWTDLAPRTYGGRTCINADDVFDEYAHTEHMLESLTPTKRSAAYLALAVAHTLTIPARFVETALTSAKLPERRQQIRSFAGYEIMDDSYNISLTTARAALSAARSHADSIGKKLLVVVAGIPESNEPEKDNRALGDECEVAGHHTIIIQSICTDYVKSGFKKPSNFTVLESIRNSVLLTLPERFPPEEWFVLLFNELRDQYH